MVVSFWALAYGVALATAGTPAEPGVIDTRAAAYSIGLAVLLVPFGLIAVAFVSRREDWPLMAFYAMGLAVAVGLPLLIFRNPLAAIIAAYAAGAVIVLSRPPGMGWHHRAIAAAVASVVAIVGMVLAFVPTAVIAPALPFTSVGLADLFTDRGTS